MNCNFLMTTSHETPLAASFKRRAILKGPAGCLSVHYQTRRWPTCGIVRLQMKLFRCSRLLYLLSGIAVIFVLADFGFHGTPGVLDVNQLETISDESSFTRELVSVNKIMHDTLTIS